MKQLILIILLLTGFPFLALSQSSGHDLDLILEKQSEREPSLQSKQETTADSFTFGRNIFERYNPVSLVLAGSLHTYSSVISPQLGQNCIYHTSCSLFSRQAIEKKGLGTGVLMTADRISRCNRIAGSDTPLHRFDQETGLIRDEVERYHR